MTPQALWYDDILDAIKADAVAIGGKGWAKVVGLMLWPEKSADGAQRQLLDCLNPDRNQRLTPEQLTLVIREARKAGSFCTIAFICGDANLSIPQPIEPEDERARLQRLFIDSVSQLDTIKKQLEKLP